MLSEDWKKLVPGATMPVAHQLPVACPGRADAPWVHPPSGVIFLRGWQRIQAVDCRRYDEHANDVSVRYGISGSLAITTYVYPLNNAEAREAAFFDAVRDMLGSLENARSGEESEVAFALGGHSLVRGRRVRAVGTPRGGQSARSVAVVEMFVRDVWTIKLRSTATLRSSELAERFFEAWLLTSGFGGDRSKV